MIARPAWPSSLLDDVARRGSGHTPTKSRPDYWEGEIHWVSLRDTFRLDNGLISETTSTISEKGLANSSAVLHPAGTVILLRDAGIGKSGIIASEMAVSQHFIAWDCGPRLRNWFLYYVLQARKGEFERISNGSTIRTIGLDYFRQMAVPLPDLDEQDRIVDVLRSVDELINALDRQIAKKCAIKQGMMQELLTGRTRLPGFAGAWSERSLGEVATILDNMRVPLSAADRAGREGHYPYCGANGIVDRIDAFMIDDDVVLLAEDGGNFDQWRTRPIAYRMVGKIWVNNHAHVLKAANRGDTGFLFYALEHKDITGVISSGTRSKLTRGELVRIPIPMPVDCGEQAAVASVLSGVDAEIAALERRLEAARAIKQGMMQELLTGHTRLVPVEASV